MFNSVYIGIIILCVMCHVSCVMCHVSCVMCHVSCVMLSGQVYWQRISLPINCIILKLFPQWSRHISHHTQNSVPNVVARHQFRNTSPDNGIFPITKIYPGLCTIQVCNTSISAITGNLICHTGLLWFVQFVLSSSSLSVIEISSSSSFIISHGNYHHQSLPMSSSWHHMTQSHSHHV